MPANVMRSAGFTLIEMIAVLVLIGIVMGVVANRVGDSINRGKVNAGIAQMRSLATKIENYALDNGGPPANLADLVTRPSNATNWNGPYATESALKDPFGHAFLYKAPGDDGRDFDLTFLGKDGQPGGDGLNRDVGNWQ
ncbi:MAG: type II secretion system major pseudopilin GspG [Rudaea sp.]